MRNRVQIGISSVGVAIGLCLSAGVLGADISYYTGARVAFSDNIRLDPAFEENETPVSAIAGMTVTQESSLISLFLDGDLQYINYTQDNFSDELLAAVDLNLMIYAIPERLDWIVTNNYGQILEDTLTSPSPSNREDVNFFSTGPDLKFRFGKTDELTISGRFADAYYETRSFDNQRYNYGASYVRALPGQRAIGLHAIEYMVDYGTVLLTDYDRTDVFLRFESETSKSQFRLDAGYSEIRPDDNSGDSSGLLAEVELSRQVTGNSMLTANYSYNYSDSGERFRNLSDEETEIGGEDVILADDPFQLQQASLTLDRTTNTDRFRFGVGWEDEDYTASNKNDRQISNFDISYMRNLTSSISVGIDGNYIHREYDTFDREDDDWYLSLVGTYELSRNIDFRLELGPRERSSKGDDTTNTGYDENRILLEVRYATGVGRR